MISDLHKINLEGLRLINHCCPGGWTKAEVFKMEMSLQPGKNVWVILLDPTWTCISHIHDLLYYDMVYHRENKYWGCRLSLTEGSLLHLGRSQFWEDNISVKLWITRRIEPSNDQCKEHSKQNEQPGYEWVLHAQRQKRNSLRLEPKLTCARWYWKWRQGPDQAGFYEPK